VAAGALSLANASLQSMKTNVTQFSALPGYPFSLSHFLSH
jgi:hypothetical protein